MADLDNEIAGWSSGKFEVPEWSFDGNPALIINHMQVGIAGGGKFSGAPYAQEAKAMKELGTIAKQKQLIAAFRERKLPVIFISVLPNPIGILPKWGFIFEMIKKAAPAGRMNTPEEAALLDVIPEMGRLPEEPLLYHTGTCPFTGSHLEDLLKHLHVTDLVFTGWTAHSTLYNSLIQATNHWFSVVVPADATGAPERDKAASDMVLTYMMKMYGLVTTVDDVIKHLPKAAAASAK
jgi:nicotinamidase-related amidase